MGTRPNFIKAFPVYKELKKVSMFDVRLINTGQHYDHSMSGIFFQDLGVTKIDFELGVGSGTHGWQTGKILEKIETLFICENPDLVLVFGDVNSTLAGALAATKLGIPVGHVESGLRSRDRSMPEEINRILTDQISEILFTTSIDANVNLEQEGKKASQIFFVGNTMIDSLIQFESRFEGSKVINYFSINFNQYCLITLHRPSNVDNKQDLKRIISQLNQVSELMPCIFPLHPRTKKILKTLHISISNTIHIVEPLGYLDFMGLQKNAKVIITDSGGIQEESTYFGIPCLTLRENTERPVTISEGTNKLVGSATKNLKGEVEKAIKQQKRKIPKYWDGMASKRIRIVLENFLIKLQNQI